MIQNRAGLHGKCARQPRHFDMLSLVTLLSFIKSCGNGGAGDKRRPITGNRNNEMDTAISMRPLTAKQSADRRDQRVVWIAVRMRPFAAEGRKVTVDESGIALAQLGVGKAKPLLVARLDINEYDIRRGK